MIIPAPKDGTGLKTRLFIEYGTLASINSYREFIKANPDIEIVSVAIFNHDDVLLTYKSDDVKEGPL